MSPPHIVIGITVAAVALAFARPAVIEAPGLRAALETEMTLFALAGAWLVRAHFICSRRVRDLVLFGALLTLGLPYFGSYAVPAAVDVRSGHGVAVVALWGELLVAVAGALGPTGVRIGDARRWLAIVTELSGVAMGLAAPLAVLLGAALYHPGSGIGMELRDPLALVLVLVAIGLFVRAAAGFARHGRASRENVASALAGAAILLALARDSQLTLRWLAPDETALPAGLRLVGYSLLLRAALRQERHVRAMVTREVSRRSGAVSPATCTTGSRRISR
jgi:hypothetical protein